MPPRSWFSATASELMQVTQIRDPRLAITHLARALLADAEINAPPVNLELIGSFQRVRSIEEVEMPHSGRLVPGNEGCLIQVNVRHTRGKNRFTVCHEIGHTLVPAYHRHPRIVQDMSTGLFQVGQEEEHLCDIAASELLLPEFLFRPRAATLGYHLNTVAELAQAFQASREATARRLVDMNIWPCAMALWHLAYKDSEAHVPLQMTLGGSDWIPPERKLRVRYAVANKQFGYYLHHNLAAPQDGCLMRCFAENAVVCGEEQLILSGRGVKLYVMAAPTNFVSANGPTREVLSLILGANSDAVRQEEPTELWDTLE